MFVLGDCVWAGGCWCGLSGRLWLRLVRAELSSVVSGNPTAAIACRCCSHALCSAKQLAPSRPWAQRAIARSRRAAWRSQSGHSGAMADQEHTARSVRDYESFMALFDGTDPFADPCVSLAAERPLPAADPLPPSPPCGPWTSSPPSGRQTAASSSAACGAVDVGAQPKTPPWRRSAPKPWTFTSSASASAPNDDAMGLSQSDAAGTNMSARKRAWAETMGANRLPSQEQHFVHKRQDITAEELQDLHDEADAARSCGIGWKERGPPGPPADDPTATWRSQKWRPGSSRWANNGGTNKQWYSRYYAAKRHGDTAKMQLFLQEYGDRFVYSASAAGPKELKEYVANRGANRGENANW
jgi:hypothetical protein